MAETEEPKKRQAIKKNPPKEHEKEIKEDKLPIKNMNIYQKLLEIQKTVNGFLPNARGFNYSYVDGDKVLGAIRPKMNELGLLLKQETASVDNTLVNYKNSKGQEKTEMFTSVDFIFTWIDCDTMQTDVNNWHGNGMNEFEKGLGSAYTYAERYFLLKYFHVPTDKDDVDNTDREPQEGEPKEPAKQTTQNKAATGTQNNQTTQSTNTEQKEYTGHEKAIRECKTLSALSDAWNAIPPKDKTEFQELKDKMKAYLDDKAAKANTNTNQNTTA